MNNVTLTRTINAPIEKVYDALTQSEQLTKWFAPEGMTIPVADMPSKAGEPYKVCMANDKGEQYCSVGTITELDKPNKVAMTWKWDEMPDAYETTLTMSLNAMGDDKTEIMLVHDGFKDEKDAGEHNKGWDSCLNRLEKLFT